MLTWIKRLFAKQEPLPRPWPSPAEVLDAVRYSLKERPYEWRVLWVPFDGYALYNRKTGVTVHDDGRCDTTGTCDEKLKLLFWSHHDIVAMSEKAAEKRARDRAKTIKALRGD